MREEDEAMIYKPENPGKAGVWYYIISTGDRYLLMAHSVRHNADRIIREYSTKAAIEAARKLNRKLGVEKA